MRDLRYALRGLRRAPGFATAVVLTLALGIGGNAAIFSVVDQLLLRPLPYPDGDQLLTVYEVLPGTWQVGFGAARPDVSPANWLDWQRESKTLASIAAWDTNTATLTGVGEPVRLNGQVVSHEFFPLLRVEPLLGRTITAADDRPNAPRVAVLSHALWQRRFGGNANVLGRIVQLNDRPFEIVGVMPPSFRFVYQDTDVWSAYQLDRARPWRDVAGRFMNVVARRQTGVTMAAASAEMSAIARRLSDTHEFNTGFGVQLIPLREELTGQVQTSLLVLYGAVGVLLSIACFNVANLLLARAAGRQREMAIRASLGAGRLAIVRQLLVESLVLAAIGGVLGIALAYWCVSALVAVAPADLLRVPDLHVDTRVALYALGLSTLTGIVVGLVPALSLVRRSFASRIRESGPGVTHTPRLRQALVVCQVAMTVVLLCGAGLLIRTVTALNAADSGFDKRNVLAMELTLPAARYASERRPEFVRQVVEALRALPGVDAVAAANSIPVIGTPRGGTVFHRLGTPELPMNDRPLTLVRVVTPGFFRTLGVPILRGREFTDADQAPNAPLAFVVNDAFVRSFLTDVDPLAASISVDMRQTNPHAPVIGVVGDVSEGSIRDRAQPTVYYSHGDLQEAGMTVFLRTRVADSLRMAAIGAVHALDANLAVTNVRTLDEAFAESVARERLNALVAGAFALSGLLLASLGLYGLLAFLVTERTKELGIRIALGAHLGRLMRGVIAGGLRLVAVGAAIGLVAAILLTRSLGALLFRVTPYDPVTYGVVLALLATVAIWASYVPARRAARVEPLTALRQD